MPAPIKSPSIQIPQYGATGLPPDALTAPDAPMVDKAPPSAAPAPAVPQGDKEFLDSVHELNEKRGAPKSDAPPAATPDKPEPKHDTTPPVFEKADKKDAAPEDSDTEEFNDPLEEDPVNADKPSKAKSIKDLKSQLKSVRNREAQVRARNEELESRLQRLEEFESKIEEFEQLKERNAHLETFEKILDIHSNPEFNAKYVEGREGTKQEAVGIVKQYGVQNGEALIDEAVKIRDNRKALNEFLKQNGLDEYGITDIRPYIFHLQQLDDERQQLEKSPEQAREQLSRMYSEREQQRVAEVSRLIHDRSHNAWNQIIGYYSHGETAVDAFKEKPGDPDHTERRNAVLQRSNEQYVNTMGALTGLGIRDFPPQLAQTLAARFQLSEWTGEFIAENKSLKKQLSDLKAQLNEANSYRRPGYNGSNGSGPKPPADVPKGTDVSSHVFEKARDTVLAREKAN